MGITAGGSARYGGSIGSGEKFADPSDDLRRSGIKLRDTASFNLPGHVRLSVLPEVAQAALKAAWHPQLKAQP